MREFRGRVAVITGGGSGIGRGLAERCAEEGMKVIIADIEESALFETESILKEKGAEVLAIRLDVSRAEEIRMLADRTMDAFGAVHLLFNNAGVECRGTLWESTGSDYEWLLNVNLWSVIHAVRVFVPAMLKQKTECHIVNTASIAGLISGPGMGIYRLTKSAVISLSETLYHELQQQDAPIGVSVLCPSFVRSRLIDAERNRPERYKDPRKNALSPRELELIAWFKKQNQNAMPPSRFAELVFDGIRGNRFYIFSDPGSLKLIERRMDDIMQQRNPTPPRAGEE
jgi:NAD(P)-dependent dehydrogenase (short-subunit alcohol dehydrogenase family)